MSEDNVKIVRRYLESPDVSAEVAEYWEEDGDYYPVRKFPEARPCHGPEEIARFMTELRDAWGQIRLVVRHASSIGDDRVLARARLETHGRTSGLALEGDLYYCFWLRHGRFFRAEDHLTAEGARRALGLQRDAPEAAHLAE
jgi:hypothetical protein